MKKEIIQYSFAFPSSVYLFDSKKERNANKRKVLGELKKYGFKGKLTPCEIRYKVEN
jgi:hypothetical protein